MGTASSSEKELGARRSALQLSRECGLSHAEPFNVSQGDAVEEGRKPAHGICLVSLTGPEPRAGRTEVTCKPSGHLVNRRFGGGGAFRRSARTAAQGLRRFPSVASSPRFAVG